MSASVPHPAAPALLTARWRVAWLTVVVAWAVVVAAYWNTLSAIVLIWLHSASFTHGFLIVPVVVYLVWQQRAELQMLTPEPAPVALLLLAALVLLWNVASLLVVNAAQHFAVVMMIPATLWLLLGSAVLRRLMFPMAYLLFAVPFGEFLVPSLQDVTAAITVKALQLTGIPVLWEGRFFYIPSGNFEVAEACSGVRYLIASLALGTLYAYVSYHALWRRAVFILLAAAVPVLANGARAYGIVMLAHLSDYQLALGVDHFIYGWVFFGAVMLLLFWLGNHFRDAPRAPVVEQAQTSAAAFAAPRSGWGWRALALVIVLSGPLLNFALQREASVLPAFELRLPPGSGEWSGPQASVDPWMPKFIGAVQQRAEYRRAQHAVQVYVAYYAQQHAGAELINPQNALFDMGSERRVSEEVETLALADGMAWTVRALRIHAAQRERLIWSWYVVAGQATANPLLAKLYEMRTRVLRSSGGAALFALATEDDPGAAARLQDFLDALRRPLHASVGGE